MTFETWVAEVQALVTFVVEPEDWRKYYDAKLSPLDAIAPMMRSDLISLTPDPLAS